MLVLTSVNLSNSNSNIIVIVIFKTGLIAIIIFFLKIIVIVITGEYSVSYQFSINSTYMINFSCFFQNKIIDDKSKDGALWSILCSISPYMLRIKKQNNERYRTIQSIFF
jgi:hypothetical protein